MRNGGGRRFQFRLRVKIALAVFVACALLASIVIVLSYRLYSNTMVKHYETLAVNIARTAASQIGADDVARYLTTQEKDDEYERLLRLLYDIKESNDCRYLYVQQLHGDSVTYLFDADTGPDACALGLTIPIEEQNVLDAVARGEVPAPFIYNGEFGWLCTGLAPITDGKGRVVAVAGADISMNEVLADREAYLRAVLTSEFIATVLIMAALIFLFELTVVRPINSMSEATGNFVAEKAAGHSSIAGLHIRTNDELEKLCVSVQTMERQINDYIEHLTRVTAEKERIGAELDVAANIQSSMLPCIFPAFPERDEFDIFASMRPAKEVGGDFYDFFFVDDDHLAVVIADVSGKGVPAALIMVIAKELIKSRMQAGETPADAFTKVNQQLCENNEAGMFVTAWAGLIELSTGRVQYACAGHNPPVIVRADGAADYLRGRSGFVLAGRKKMKYHPMELTLDKGDLLYLYTDGVTEATDLSNQLFGEERLLNILREEAADSPEELLRTVSLRVDDFDGDAPQFDDETMLAVRILGPYTERTFPAEGKNVDGAVAFTEKILREGGCPEAVVRKCNVAVDELFANVCSYSGSPEITVGCRVAAGRASLRIIDSGACFDPLDRPAPDVTLAASQRQIGGLGIHIVKKSMDLVRHRYADGKNIVTMEIAFSGRPVKGAADGTKG